MIALDVTGLTVRRGRRVLLGPIDVKLLQGRAAALIDETGLAARALFGALDRDLRAAWEARLGEREILGPSDMAAATREGEIVLIARGGERAPVSPHLTVLDLFDELPWTQGVEREEIARRAGDAASAAGLDWNPTTPEGRVGELDLASRRRLSIALALSSEARVLVMEAPGPEIDASTRFGLVRRVVDWTRARGASLLLCVPRAETAGALVDQFIPPLGRPFEIDPRADVPPDTPDRDSMITVRDLRVAIPMGRTLTGSPRWRAVIDGVGFELDKGGSTALLGESGGGKSALARSLIRLSRPVGGCVVWRGKNLVSADDETLRAARRDLRILTADPRGALDPRARVGAAMERSLAALRPDLPRAKRADRIERCLRRVGLSPEIARRHVFSLSNGEAARAALARALVTEPKLLVCDEPTEGLGTAEEERLIAILLELNREGLMLIYATSRADLALRIGRRILVLNAGRVAEDAPAIEIARNPRHPLTQAMLAPLVGESGLLDVDPSRGARGGRGCPLRPRCPRGIGRCGGAPAALKRVGPSHLVACHSLADEVEAGRPET